MQLYKVLLVTLITMARSRGAEGGPVQVVAGSESHRLKEVRLESGLSSLTIKDEDLRFYTEKSRERFAHLVVFFNPATRRYFWNFIFAGAGLKNPPDSMGTFSAPFITHDGFFMFYASFGVLFVEECDGEAFDLDEAEAKILSEIDSHVSEMASGRLWHKKRRINLRLPEEFCLSPMAASPNATLIESVARDGDNWVVKLSNRWKVEVRFDAQFNLVGTSRIN